MIVSMVYSIVNFIDLPGYILLIRFAAFRDIELRYFANLDQRSSIAAHNRTKFADHLLLQNCIFNILYFSNY